MKLPRIFPIVTFLAGLSAASAQLTVTTLHPMMSDLARQVGGEHVKIVEMVKPGTDPHDFSPKPSDLKSAKNSTLILASGKQMENYLDKLRDNLTANQTMIEVGATIPDLTEKEVAKLNLEEIPHDHHHDGTCNHHHGPDPHWWNSVKSMIRATDVVKEAFTKADPANAAAYKANAKAFSARLSQLGKWAKKELSAIPSENRKLASAHASMGYFADEYQFKLLAIQGISPSVKATSQQIAGAIQLIKKHQIKAIFTEQGVNPKQLEEIVRETGVKKGAELIADGNGVGEHSTFEKAFQYNVTSIVAALK